MAANHIKANANNARFTELQREVGRVRAGIERLNQFEDILIHMRDGDGSEASHYALAQTEFGIAASGGSDANTQTKAMFDELASVVGALNNASAAVNQIAAKLGV